MLLPRGSRIAHPLLKLLSFACHNHQHRTALLSSRYHRQGPPSFHVAANLKKILSPHLSSIADLAKHLDKTRGKVLKSDVQCHSDELVELESVKKQLVDDYIKGYEHLIERVQKCPLNNEWIYQVISWYNMAPLYKSLVERLIEAREEELKLLLKALSLMDYQWNNPYGIIDQDLFKEQNISNLYKRIGKYNLDLQTIKKLEEVLVVPVNFSKRQFYNKYFNFNIPTLLKYLQVDDQNSLSDLLWLMHTYIRSMNDDEQGIIILEKYLITQQPTLTNKDKEHLMGSYQLKGRINKSIYELFIKPYIVKTKMINIEDLIDMVKFTICSESGDMQLLKRIYELIASKYLERRISSSRHTYTLHLYTHYLLCKGYKINLPANLKKDMTIYCKQRADGRINLNHLLSKGNKMFTSPCLDNTKKKVIREFEPTKTSVFEEQFGHKLKEFILKDYDLYEKPVICCFQLDYVLAHKTKRELVNIEIEGIQYVFTSGRLIREREVRDEVLQYYGIKVNHIDYNLFKLRRKYDEDELLMHKRSDC